MSPTAPAPTRRPTNVRWAILGLLIAASAISYFLRSNISFSGPVLMQDLGLSETQFGYVLAAFTAGYAIFQFPGGLLTDWIGSRRALTIITALWALLTILTALLPDDSVAGLGVTLLLLVAIRFLVGMSHAPMFPLSVAVTERWFPVGRWALANALTSVGLTLGAAAAALVLPLLIAAWGWRSTNTLVAPLGLAIAALWWWYARDSAAEHRGANESEVALITANRPHVVPPQASRPAWLRLLKNRNVLLLTAAYFCSNYVFYQFFSWTPYYLQTVRGFDATVTGVITAAQWVAGSAGALAGGYVCDYLVRHHGLRRGCAWPAAGGILVAGLLLAVGAASSSPVIAAWTLAATFFFQQATEGAFGAATMGIGHHHSGGAFGVVNTGANIAGAFGAVLMPFVAGLMGWPVAMMTGLLFAVASAVLWIGIRADEAMAD